MFIATGAICGLVAMILGAYADHGLQESLSPDHLASVKTAIRYMQINAVVLVAIGLAQLSAEAVRASKLLTGAGWMFCVGTLLFSGGILLGRVFGLAVALNVTPIGGMVQMAGWALLIAFGLKRAQP